MPESAVIDILGLMPPERLLESITSLFDNMGDALLLVDNSWSVVYANPVADRQLACVRDRAKTISLWTLLGLPVHSPVVTGLQKAVSERVPTLFNDVAGFDHFVTQVRGVPIDTGMFVSLRNGSACLTRDLLDRTMQSVSEFLSSAAIGFAYVDDNYRYQVVNTTLAGWVGALEGTDLGQTSPNFKSTLTRRLSRYIRYVGETGKPILSVPISGDVPARPNIDAAWMLGLYPVTVPHSSRIGVAVAIIEVTEKVKLQKSLQLWRNIFEHATWGVIISEPYTRKMLSMNDAFAKMHGYDRSELIGQPLDVLFAPEDMHSMFVNSEAVNVRGDHTFQLYHCRKDGSRFPLLVHATTFRDSGGNIVYRAAVCDDITDRKRLEHDLQTSRERLRLAVEGAKLGTWHWNLRDNTLTYSARAKEIFGMAPDEPPTVDGFLRRIYPEDRPMVDEVFARMLRGAEECNLEFRIVHPDGSVHWVADKARTYEDADHNVVSQEGIVEDIDARKRSEAAAREREVQFRRFAESDVIGVVVTHFDGRIVFANDRFLNMLGYTREDFEAGLVNWRTMTPPEYVEVSELNVAAILEKGTTEYEKEYIGKDGRRVPVLIGLALLTDDVGGGKIGFVLDLTARKQAEEQIKITLKELGTAYTKEHRIATSLQRSLLQRPSQDAFGPLEVETVYRAALDDAEVGGDFYDITTLDGGLISVAVGDVSGKGLDAAAQTNEIKYILRAFVSEDPDPARSMERVNRYLCRHFNFEDPIGDRFVCLMIALIDPVNRTARICVAGAEPPIVRRAAAGADLVDASGMALGIVDGSRYDAAEVCFDVGDILIATTDGITEARRGYSFLGADGLADLAASADINVDIHSFTNAILEGARNFCGGEFRDDVCLFVARFT